MRVKLTIAYDGSGYAGWQTQENAVGIQNVIEEAVSKIEGKPVRITGAGRTDKGVHALGQAAHFDTEGDIPGDKWVYHLNPRLPDAIRIVASQEVAPEFHARFDAKSKHYLYTLRTDALLPPAYRHIVAHEPNAPDISAMRRAAKLCHGHHNFSAFMASGSPVANTHRTLDALRIEKDRNEIRFHFEAESFLYHQVRILTGTLVAIGQRRMTNQDLRRALESGVREHAGPTMPAAGLTLVSIRYDKEAQ